MSKEVGAGGRFDIFLDSDYLICIVVAVVKRLAYMLLERGCTFLRL